MEAKQRLEDTTELDNLKAEKRKAELTLKNQLEEKHNELERVRAQGERENIALTSTIMQNAAKVSRLEKENAKLTVRDMSCFMCNRVIRCLTFLDNAPRLKRIV